jgi:hypothetical protein
LTPRKTQNLESPKIWDEKRFYSVVVAQFKTESFIRALRTFVSIKLMWIFPNPAWMKMQFFLILFLGTITLIRRAQQRSYLNKLENTASLLGFLPHEEHTIANLKDTAEEVNKFF